MKESNSTPKIFLSYAREDSRQVEELYLFLSNAGFEPWMDKHNIFPGEDWRESIQHAIETSDFFLACMSPNSVDKRGIVQKEIRTALDAVEGMLESDIYLIPVRLEECQIPGRLKKYQWVDLFEIDGWSKLQDAIVEGMKRRTDKNSPPAVSTRLPVPNFISVSDKKSKTGLLTRYRILAGLLLTALVLLSAPWIYNNNFYRVPRPTIPTEFCQTSPVPIEVGVAQFPECSSDFRADLVKNWQNEKVKVSVVSKSMTASSDARNDGSNYDIVVWGECGALDANTASLQYELITARKPFEIYEPITLVASGNIDVQSALGLAIFDYRFGDFSEAHRRLSSMPVTATTADLNLLRANSSLLNLQSVTALAEFKEITRLFPSDSAAAYNNMGVAISSEDRNQALGWFNQAVVLAVDSDQIETEALARVNRSQMYLLEKKWEEARDDCDQAVLLDAKAALPYVCLARYNFSYFRFGAPWLPLPLNEISKNLRDAEKYEDTPAMVHYLRADWHLSHFWKEKRDAVDAYMRYLSEMENRACLPTDLVRNADARGILENLTVIP